MALRIIRKSSSQSQVELIKGTSDQKPNLSLMLWVDSAESLAASLDLIKDEWLQENAEILIYKSESFVEQIRGQLPQFKLTAKLINESKASTWSSRLRTLIQESSTDYCLFVPFNTPHLVQTLQALFQALKQDSSLALVAPALCSEQTQALFSAGQDFSQGLTPHHLNIQEQSYSFEPLANSLFYLYQGLALTDWQQIAKKPLQVTALPLVVSGVRREAYLSVNWSDQDWSPSWLAQDLALGLRQKQYRLAVLPQTLTLTNTQLAWLEVGEAPTGFIEKWQPLLRQVIFELYRQHGWKQSADTFTYQNPTGVRVQDYLSSKEVIV